jgi:apolipoprotein N-acyltransferase
VLAFGGVLGLVVAIAAWGSWRIAAGVVGPGERVTIGLVQGNIAQEDKWNPAASTWILERYLTLSRVAAARGATLIVWPESATPFFFEEEPAQAEHVRSLARETRAHLLIGSDQIEPGDPPRYYNAAFLVRPDGTTAQVYRKIHLVPFGEYVPLARLLFFAAPLVESVSDFSAGTDPVALQVGSHRTSTAICYEVVYPDLIRGFVLAGSELLSTITNDAWYGRSSAPHQHFAQAAMRAIEQGRYLVRAANTGVSGVVDPYGRVLRRSAIFETDVIVHEVEYLTALTVYGRFGDVFAYACLALTIAAVLAAVRGRRA